MKVLCISAMALRNSATLRIASRTTSSSRPESGEFWGELPRTKLVTTLASSGLRVTIKKIPPEERFWAKVEKTDSCWIWKGNVLRDGYGQFCADTGRYKVRKVKMMKAHRYAYELLVGKIPDGMVTDHLCKNTICVNPSHMEIVTPVENVMRGDSPAAINARKTHCHRGHELVPENIANSKDGARRCLICLRANHRESERRRRLRLKEASR